MQCSLHLKDISHYIPPIGILSTKGLLVKISQYGFLRINVVVRSSFVQDLVNSRKTDCARHENSVRTAGNALCARVGTSAYPQYEVLAQGLCQRV